MVYFLLSSLQWVYIYLASARYLMSLKRERRLMRLQERVSAGCLPVGPGEKRKMPVQLGFSGAERDGDCGSPKETHRAGSLVESG